MGGSSRRILEPGSACRRLLVPLVPALSPLVSALVTLAIMVWEIQRPSYWRDEAATVSAVHRPLAGLLRMLGHVDAVHGAYYLLLWPVARVAGTGEVATRLPSAMAMAVAAALVAAIGRRLVSPRAGLAAGLMFAVIPVVSRYGQDARPYAIVTALTACASYLLVRAYQEADPAGGGSGSAAGEAGSAADVRRVRRWLAAYACCVGALGVIDIFALLVIPAHAITVALAARRARGRLAGRAAGLPAGRPAGSSASPRLRPGPPADVPGGANAGANAGRRLVKGWLAAAAAATAVTSPVIVLGFAQRSTLGWLTRPGVGSVTGLVRLAGTAAMAAAAGVVVAAGTAVAVRAARKGQSRLAARWPAGLPALCLPWLILPPAALLAASEITPVFTFRYVLLCAPAAALLVGAGLAALGRAAGAACLAVIAVLGLHQQQRFRADWGHLDNIRQVDRVVAAARRPGDAVLYRKPQNFSPGYPYGLGQLTSVARAARPVASATLAGTYLPPPVVRERLGDVRRLWVAEYYRPSRVPILKGLGFRLVRRWHIADIWLFLYEHPGG